ncbi:hypothetical protein GOODEAATRI_014680 [Goodea atripinnis]|uniref:Nucleolar protein 6 n=1 Tax=Goodea atripinnis TaxID=208336 RepID=A0ABV0NVU7_9TELE
MHPSDFSHDDDDEEEQLDAPVKPKRTKVSEEEEVVYHPVKLSRNDLYRPPTAEELNHLKEAESLFHCSLLKMQMEELLKEVALSERKKQQIDSFVKTVTKLLETVPASPEVEVCIVVRRELLSQLDTEDYLCYAVSACGTRAHLQFLSAIRSQCSAFSDGITLLKVWLHQRELDQGTGCFNGFLASMLLAYLLMTHRISNTMTAYQLLRNSLNFLGTESSSIGP